MESSRDCINTKNKDEKLDFPDPNKNLLWKLHLQRREAFEEMNCDVDKVVNHCLGAKQHLEAVQDSNRNLIKERNALRSKYEALLAKNRKDTGIIERLQQSEILRREALESREIMSKSYKEVLTKNREKCLDRKILQDEKKKLLLKSQIATNIIRKNNIKHKKMYEAILDQNKGYEKNEERFAQEKEQLKSAIPKNDDIFQRWLKSNAERDAAIRSLQEEMESGLMVHSETDDEASEEATESDPSSITSETSESLEEEKTGKEEMTGKEEKAGKEEMTGKEEKTGKDEKTAKEDMSGVKTTTEDTESRGAQEKPSKRSPTQKQKEKKESKKGSLQKQKEIAFKREWLRKKTLVEVAEKEKEYWMDFYELLNNRMQDLSIETVNARKLLSDKQAERGDLLKKAEVMEKLIAQKRRNRSVPPRASIEEMKIWIGIQRESNDALRKIASSCLSTKLQDYETYSEFAQTIRKMFLDALKEQLYLEFKTEDGEKDVERVTE